MNPSLSRNAPNRVAQRRPATWTSADYAAVGGALQIVGDELCETLNLYQDSRVLDVAVGNSHASLAAARRWCDVTSTDFAPDLANRARLRADAENLGVRFVAGEPEDLPFPDQSFDAVVSTFGAMFAPDQERAASEMIRVCRRGGCIGLTAWTPDGFIGQLFALIDRHAGTTCGAAPFAWGTGDRLHELFAVYGGVDACERRVAFRARTPAEWVEKFRAGYAPVLKTSSKVEPDKQRALTGDLLELVTRFNRAKDKTMVVDADYLEVVVVRR